MENVIFCVVYVLSPSWQTTLNLYFLCYIESYTWVTLVDWNDDSDKWNFPGNVAYFDSSFALL